MSVLPPSTRSIILVEFMERYAYYAFRSVLVSFFVDKLLFPESSAISAFMYTSALAYFTPLAGGLLSDALLGKYLTIKIFSTVYVAGLALLSFGAFTLSAACVFLGLLLIGVGTGGIKPCVSSFGADQLKYVKSPTGEISPAPSSSSSSMRLYFSAFYFAINVGALLSYIFSPLAKHYMGYGFAFLFPAIFMAAALAVLVNSKPSYVVIKPDPSAPTSPVAVILRILMAATTDLLTSCGRSSSTAPRSFLDRATRSSSSTINQAEVADAKDFFRTIKFVLLMPLFWMLFDQQGSAWVLQAKRMDVPGWLEAEQLGVCNTGFVLVLLPIMEKKVYPWLSSIGREPTPLRRMGLGMFFGGASFIVSALVETSIQNSPPHSVPVFIQLPQYLILTIGEIGVSTTGLEVRSKLEHAQPSLRSSSPLSLALAQFFYEEAPPSMRTASASLFLLTTAMGDVMGGLLYDIAGALGISNAALLYFCGFTMFVATAVFIAFARTYRYRASERGRRSDDDGDEGDVQLSLVGKGRDLDSDVDMMEGDQEGRGMNFQRIADDNQT